MTGAGTERLFSIGSLVGSEEVDVLVGDDRTNGLLGSGGNDRLFGRSATTCSSAIGATIC